MKLDRLDSEELVRFMDRPIWGALWGKIGGMLEANRTLCETAGGDELLRAQGAVAALRRVRDLPEILMREIKAAQEIPPKRDSRA
jgi:hypothetical protein